MNFKVNLFFHLYETHITPLGIPIPTVPRVSDGVITWGCCFPPPFQQIIFCIFLCQPWKCKSLEKASHYSFCKNDAHSSFSTYISPKIADSHFARAFIVIQALVSQNALHIKLIGVHLLTIQVRAPADHPGFEVNYKRYCCLCESNICGGALLINM